MNATGDPFRMATRGSDLALRQAAGVREALERRRRAVDLVEVETRGDRVRDELIHRLGKTGAFVRALDERVLDGEVDAAVHSMKDVPTEFPDDLIVAGVPERGPAGDLLVTPDGRALQDLPAGAIVGTSSLRRKAQLLAERPDLTVEPLRGNVDTRIEKLLAPSLQREHQRRLDAAEDDGEDADDDTSDTGDDAPEIDDDRSPEEWFEDLTEIEREALSREVETEFDAVVLAEAGLDRAGLLGHVEYQRLPPEEFVPAPGQGALAITAVEPASIEAVRSAVEDPVARVATTVERTLLAELGGGCVAPIGVHAGVRGEYVHVTVRVLATDGSEEVAASRDLPIEEHADAAAAFADDLRERGAADLIEAAKAETDEETRGKRDT